MFCRIGLLVLLLLTISPALPIMAQGGDNACPALVEMALEAVGDACGNLGRGEVCYGHILVTATTWEEVALDDFDAPGDLADVFELASLATFPMDVDDEVWGVALLALQADLPDTLPGQNVIFVLYGDAELRSDVPPETLNAPTPIPLPTCTGTTSSGTNLRTGPSTNYAVAGSVGAGEDFIVSGRNSTNDWLRIEYRDQFVWVYAELLSLDCDADTLPQVNTEDVLELAYTTPMQAFYLTTSLGAPACEEAPRDGLLIQAPQDTTVHFMINGVGVTVGSTALLQVAGNTLGVNTFTGTVDVTSAGRTQSAAPGQRVDAASGRAPDAPVPYDMDDVANAPVELLPEPVQIPPPASTQASATVSPTDGPVTVIFPANAVWFDSGVVVTAGQIFTIAASGTVNTWPSCVTDCPALGRENCAFTCPIFNNLGPAGAPWTNVEPGALGYGQHPMENTARVHALIGRIGDGPPFEVGEGGTFTAYADGTVQFRLNDWDVRGNQGTFTIVLSP